MILTSCPLEDVNTRDPNLCPIMSSIWCQVLLPGLNPLLPGVLQLESRPQTLPMIEQTHIVLLRQ